MSTPCAELFKAKLWSLMLDLKQCTWGLGLPDASCTKPSTGLGCMQLGTGEPPTSHIHVSTGTWGSPLPNAQRQIPHLGPRPAFHQISRGSPRFQFQRNSEVASLSLNCRLATWGLGTTVGCSLERRGCSTAPVCGYSFDRASVSLWQCVVLSLMVICYLLTSLVVLLESQGRGLTLMPCSPVQGERQRSRALGS